MDVKIISRREFINLGLLISMPALYGCSKGFAQPILRASKGSLPKELTGSLPQPWLIKPLELKSKFESDQLVIVDFEFQNL